ncbi:hypothetical protein PROVRETT_07865 [Providencia rettgeri DSM 1131]|nr:hypothetical protein PROVRETT_07865 [Providencia rettgeri DSM 1131]
MMGSSVIKKPFCGCYEIKKADLLACLYDLLPKNKSLMLSYC